MSEVWKKELLKRIISNIKAGTVPNHNMLFLRSDCSNNDYVTNFKEFIKNHDVDEVISHIQAVRDSEGQDLCEMLDKIIENNLTKNQQTVLKMHCRDNLSEKEISKALRDNGQKSDATAVKHILHDGLKNLRKNYSIEKLFYSTEEYEKLLSWDTLPLHERYPDIMDAKICELEISDSLKDVLYNMIFFNKIETSDYPTVGEVIDHFDLLPKVRGCGKKKQTAIKEYFSELLGKDFFTINKTEIER